MSKKQQKIINERILDDFRARARHSSALKELGDRKVSLSTYLVASATVGIAIMVVEVELRTQGARRPMTYDVLRSLGVASTAVTLVLLVAYHRLIETILRKTQIEASLAGRALSFGGSAALLLVGVIPPGVETTYELALFNDADDPTHWKTMHIDTIGLLQIFRFLLIFRWAMNWSLLSDPILLAWQHNVVISPTFRSKYLFNSRPW